MNEIKKCLKEWNAIIEALGEGKTTILIRHQGTKFNELLLYPTIDYAKKYNLLNMFKENERKFVENNLYPFNEDNFFKVKYYVKVEEIIKKPVAEIDKYDKFHIWTKDHVKSYFFDKTIATIWLLRVYELDEPQMLKKTIGMTITDVEEPVQLKGKPVMSDGEFAKLKEEILNISNL